MVKSPPADTGNMGSIPRLGRFPGGGNGDPLHMLAWEIPWTKELGRLQSMGSQRVRYDIATKQQHLGRKHRKGEFLSISLTSLNDISYVSRTQKVVIYFGLQDSGQIWKTSDL